MEKAGLEKNEKVHVWNLANGERIETYAVPGEKGEITINGAAAHRFAKGDKVIIVSFEIAERALEPKIVLVDDRNAFQAYL